MSQYLLGVDNGGTMTKSSIFDSQGAEIATVGKRLVTLAPAPGYTERNLDEVWEANCQVIREVIEKSGIDPRDIRGIGLTGYGNGLCLVDEAGNPVCNGIVSSDNRGQELVNEARRTNLEEKIFSLNHQGLWSAQTSTLLAWVHRNDKETLDKARWFLSINDFIRMKLTGEAYSDITEASSAGLLNIHTLEYDRELFALLGLENYFHLAPPCLGCCDKGGEVTAVAAALTGLAQGTPVTGSMFDVNAGMLASGILDSSTLCLIAGTWSINEYLVDGLYYGYNESTNAVSKAFLPGYYLVEESTPTSASNFEWFLEQFLEPDRPELGKGPLYDECNRLVDSISPEESDIVFVPYLFSSATHPDAKACFFNLTSYSTRAHVIRAIYEGVVFSSMFHVKRLMTDGRTFERARLSGGLTNSPVWTQMMADVLQMPIDVLQASELSAQGVCIAAGIGCGLFTDYASATEGMVKVKKTYYPNPERREIYRKKFAAYEKAQAALDFFHS